MRAILSLSVLATLTACNPPKDSKVNEQWNERNNPVLMMAYDNEFVTQFDALPLSGRPEKMPWSDHYWPTYHGGLTYRWNSAKTKLLDQKVQASSDRVFAGQLDNNPELQKLRSEVMGYTPYTKEQLAALSERERTRLIDTLSPAEKYDIYRGDFKYSTVNEERKRTNIFSTLRDKPEYKADAKIPTWFGICHSWAPATILFNEPGPVNLKSKDGFQVPMAASDVKALLSHMLDKDPSQARVDRFLAERCNNDISEATIDTLMELFVPLQIGNKELISKQVNLLFDSEKLDTQTMLVAASFMYAFYSDQATAAAEYQKLFENLRRNTGRNSALSLAYLESQKNFADAGTPVGTNLETIRSNIVKAVEKPACNDTNAGAFHLVIANVMGIQKQSFGIDATRDYEVWNQAAASYESSVVKEFKGDEISSDAAPGTVRELQIRTRFRYTTEENPARDPFGDDVSLQRYHVQLGDNYIGSDGRRFKALDYKIELDRAGNIIGGTWLSKVRPDFLWGTGNAFFSKEFGEIEDIYYQSLQR